MASPPPCPYCAAVLSQARAEARAAMADPTTRVRMLAMSLEALGEAYGALTRTIAGHPLSEDDLDALRRLEALAAVQTGSP